MNAIARVAIQCIKNYCRSRRSTLWIALFVAVPIFLYVLCVPSPQGNYVKLDHDDLVLLGSVKLSSSVAREAIAIKESPYRALDSRIQTTQSTRTDCQGNRTKCGSTKVDDIIIRTATRPLSEKIHDSKPYISATKHVKDNATAKGKNRKTVPVASATPKRYIRPQTAPNHSLSSHTSHLNSLPIKGLLSRVLVIYDNFSVDSAKGLKVFLQTQRIDFDLYSTSSNKVPPPLSKLSTETDEVIGRYALILCADIGILFNRVGEAERHLFYDYSRAFNVSIIAVKRTAFDVQRGYTEAKFNYGKYLIFPVRSGSMNHVKVDDRRQWLFTKSGVTVTNIPRSAHWQVFLTIESQNVNNEPHNDSPVSSERTPNHHNHLSLEFLRRRSESTLLADPSVLAHLKYAISYTNSTRVSHRTSPLVLVDRDVIPGAVTLLIGMDIRFWLTKLLLMDMIRSYSSTPLLRFGNKRWVMVDIDDIFVAPLGLRMTTDDVEVFFKNVLTCTCTCTCN